MGGVNDLACVVPGQGQYVMHCQLVASPREVDAVPLGKRDETQPVAKVLPECFRRHAWDTFLQDSDAISRGKPCGSDIRQLWKVLLQEGVAPLHNLILTRARATWGPFADFEDPVDHIHAIHHLCNRREARSVQETVVDQVDEELRVPRVWPSHGERNASTAVPHTGPREIVDDRVPLRMPGGVPTDAKLCHEAVDDSEK